MEQTGLFLTHVWSDRIARHFDRLVRETEGVVRWHLVRDHGDGDMRCETLVGEPAASVLSVRHERMREAGTIHGGLLDSLIWPFLLATDSDFVWLIEYDVDFSGDWATFFRQFQTSGADLLTTTLDPRSDCEDWFWWSTALVPAEVPPEQLYRGFHPLMRVSRRFAHEYRRSMEDPAWSGHYEFTLPTAALAAGLSVEDIGGSGPLCPEHRRGRNYRSMPRDGSLPSGTFVWRPIRKRYFIERPRDFEVADLLYHPVKPNVANWEAPPAPRKTLMGRLRKWWRRSKRWRRL
ncbi:hypothetical protein DFR52_10172 [Hoeflea marina]|uniref:Uncharacterized protein n=1 Tax=Hoeflea marina TaxID=274592 RepID=A0A317PPL2_9HYPH|nr:hypothetical protein [Hoeflea marina]PWW03392.1 hypothetical protein DFR52_10172 [Hoeflea marina]